MATWHYTVEGAEIIPRPRTLTPEGRKPIYTATVIEAQTSKPRRAVRTRGHFPNDEAVAKSIYIDLSSADCGLSEVDAVRAPAAGREKPARHRVRRPLPNGAVEAPAHRIKDSLVEQRALYELPLSTKDTVTLGICFACPLLGTLSLARTTPREYDRVLNKKAKRSRSTAILETSVRRGKRKT